MKDKEREKVVLEELRELVCGMEDEYVRVAVDAPLSIENGNIKAGRRSRKAAKRLLDMCKRYICLSIEKDRDYFYKSVKTVEREALGLPIRPGHKETLMSFKGVPKQERKEYARKLREEKMLKQEKGKEDNGGTIS